MKLKSALKFFGRGNNADASTLVRYPTHATAYRLRAAFSTAWRAVNPNDAYGKGRHESLEISTRLVDIDKESKLSYSLTVPKIAVNQILTPIRDQIG